MKTRSLRHTPHTKQNARQGKTRQGKARQEGKKGKRNKKTAPQSLHIKNRNRDRDRNIRLMEKLNFQRNCSQVAGNEPHLDLCIRRKNILQAVSGKCQNNLLDRSYRIRFYSFDWSDGAPCFFQLRTTVAPRYLVIRYLGSLAVSYEFAGQALPFSIKNYLLSRIYIYDLVGVWLPEYANDITRCDCISKWSEGKKAVFTSRIP
ncbi:hypothetical protein P167DRAFT_354634 [Morchella conica CCBAS932]|uniref:Uncharacterized protein n=1 Tax=Morchella conica CCBAS932 TaxID=1392247 RepID=A0A3N4L3W5_9PEZI|nr:hypothetical protein P167DRAFT_354634 [Morchella conica CCBAS932]